MSGLLGCLARVAAALIVCAALLVAVVWFAAGGRARSAAEPTPVPAALGAPSATPIPATAEAQPAATAEAKLRAAEADAKAAPAGVHAPVAVTLSEAEVNALAAPQLAGDRDFPLQQPAIAIHPGQVVVTGQAPVGPVNFPVTVTGTIAVLNGVPSFTVTSVQASGVAAPQSLNQQLTEQLATSLRLTPADLPIVVQQVTLGDHTVTIAGVTK